MIPCVRSRVLFVRRVASGSSLLSGRRFNHSQFDGSKIIRPPPPNPPAPKASGFENAGSTGSQQAGSSGTGAKKSSFWSIFFRRAIRAVQIGVISFSIYKYGVQTGMMIYMHNPEEMDKQFMDMAMQRKGVQDVEPEPDIVRIADQNGSRVRHIVKRLTQSAKEIADQEAHVAIEKFRLTNDEDDRAAAEKWIRAKKIMSGNWEVVLLKNPAANAFVTPLCPKKIFVFAGLLKELAPTDDELAMVLAHELSHSLLEHGGEDDMTFHSILLMLQLVFITLIDPVGFYVFALDYGANYIRQIFEASYSREHETEADVFGLRISSNACFHTENGITVMKKLAELDRQLMGSGDYSHTHWNDDHPASIERFEHLLQLHATAPELYNHSIQSKCKSVVEDLYKSGVWGIFGRSIAKNNTPAPTN